MEKVLRKKDIFARLSQKEKAIFRKLSSPVKIQDYIEKLSINFEPNGDTLRSPRGVLESGEAHCIEGALLAAAVLWHNGRAPLLLDLRTIKADFDHVVALFRQYGRWGAISKSNHAVLRWREPVYKSIRELAMSYFHEYYADSGLKSLREYSRPFDLRRYKDCSWVTSSENLWYIAEDLDDSRHFSVATRAVYAGMRRVDPIELTAGGMTVFKKGRKGS